LYKIKAKDINLEENQTYKLVVKRNDGALITEAKTVILPDMQLKENRTLLGSPPRLNVSGRLSIFWTASDVRVSKMYDISMLMQIQEVPKDGSPVRKLNLEWVIAKGFVPNPNTGEVKYDALLVEYRQSNDAFYEFLAKNLEGSKPATRKLEFVKIKVSSGDNELFQYLDVANINLGITGTEVIPTYSNIKNGYGLFSSRNYFISKELYLNENSLDSLYNSRLTKRFGFVD
jgi:hypothetical protein